MDQTDCEPAKSCTTSVHLRSLPGFRWAAPPRGRSCGARGTSVELISKVPLRLGLALPTVIIVEPLTVLQRVAVAFVGLGAAVAPVGISVSKVPLSRLHAYSWAQMRKWRGGLQGTGRL